MSDALDAVAFRFWLASRSDLFVGLAGDSRRCPLACWLADVERKAYWVGGGWYGADGVQMRKLPAWANCFVELIDRTYGERLVMRVGALALLDRCLKEG